MTQPFSASDTVQILSLDGGGLKGLYSASVIKALEEQAGSLIANHFDIITGTSTGGLIALALSLGKSGSEIQDFYLNKGELIFPSRGLGGCYRSLRSWLRPKYSNGVLKNTLKELLQTGDCEEPTLLDSQKRLVIPTFVAEESKPRLLKTPHKSTYRRDWKMPMWAVGMATSAAPTYLPAFTYENRDYLDGGLWANNPSLVGLLEAKDLGADIKNIRVLNIGTTESFSPVRKKRAGKLGWAKKILEVLMEANSYATSKMYLDQLIEQKNFYAINKKVDSKYANLDRVNLNELTGIGETCGERAYPKIKDWFEHRPPPYEADHQAIK